MSKLIDCCIFNEEVEMLNFRLHELDWVVDKFVVVESVYTFQGQKKDLVFERNKEKFNDFKDKIIYVIHDKPSHPNPWINERALRNAAKAALNKLQLSSIDYLGISDVDEIPDTNTLNLLKKTRSADFLGFLPNFYYYNLSWRKKKKLPGPIFGKVDRLYYRFDFELDEMREAFKVADPEVKVCGYGTFSAGGWHLSCFGSVEKIINKIKSYSHSEYNKPEFVNPENIKQLIKEGKDIVMRGEKEDLVKVQETYLPQRVDLIPQIIL